MTAMSRIMLTSAPYGCYEVTLLDGEEPSILIQSDWDFPGVATTFGWTPCPCGGTDGTVDCPHKTASQMIAEAQEYLDSHEGTTAEDPGYSQEEE